MSEKGKRTLVNLTEEFISILTSSQGEEVDLSKIGEELDASKRRIYDVTNVLAGIGLIQRSGKSRVKWVGDDPLIDESLQIRELTEREAELDQMSKFVSDALLDLAESEDFKKHAWLSHEDIANLSPEALTMFALRGPTDMTIEVPEALEDEDGQNSHCLVCNSQVGSIDLISIDGGRMNNHC
jgi:transcription factor E2F3